VKDNKKIFVKKWGLRDDDMNVLIFDRGRLLFQKSGKMSESERNEALKILQRAVDGS
jgi:predicted transcriptional regulator